MELVGKAALVAEIEKRIEAHKSLAAMAADKNLRNTLEANELLIRSYRNLIHFINTLEVKWVECGDIQPMSEVVKIGETEIYLEDDGGEPPYDGKQWLDLGCIEHEIPTDKFNDGDIVEILIRKIGTKQIE